MDACFNDVKVISYFLWEYTNHDNALGLWSCAEDIACHFEEYGLTMEDFRIIRSLSKTDLNYIAFIRQIAYRIYVYTQNEDHILNWYVAERLIMNGEWCDAIIRVANYYQSEKQTDGFLSGIRSIKVKKFYSNQSQDTWH